MIHRVFTVYDSKSEAYLQPFFLQTVGQAVRSITDCVRDSNHQFNRHPEDYTLFEIGSFEDNTAVFEVHKTPVSLGKCLEFIEESPSVPNLHAMKG